MSQEPPGLCGCRTDEFGVQQHPSNCPTVAWIKDLQRQLLPELIEMDRVRRRGAAEARNYVIG